MLLLLTLVASVAYLADQMYGVVAYTYGYLAFCLLSTLVLGAVWRVGYPKSAPVFALAAFSSLAVNFVLPAPSARLQRAAMLQAAPGTDSSVIEDIVIKQYKDSPYALPWIHADKAGGRDRVHVSLLSQNPRNCTSVIFILENGKVSRSIYSPD
ncbi:MAG: hypothetical protein ACO3RV_02170 [Luteolibacter sp.]